MSYIIKGVRCANCKKELFSMSRHHFVSCGCPADTFVDGGWAYLRVGGCPEFQDNGDLLTVIKESDVPQKESAW
jgi:hypothetical protein